MERQAEGPLSFYQRFLRITFRTFRCSCARARAPTHVRVHIHSAKYTYIHTYPRSLSFLSSPPPLWSPPSTSCPILLHPPRRSPSASLSPSFRAAFRPPLRRRRRYCTYVCNACARVYVRLVSIVVREVSCRTAPRSRGERAALYVGERENVF